MQHRTLKLWIGFVLLLAVCVVGFVLTQPDSQQTPTDSPAPTVLVEPSEAMPEPSSTPSKEPTPSTSATSSAVQIAGSAPTKIYVPRLKKTVILATRTCPVVLKDGQAMLDPDRNDFTKACYFVGGTYPYVLPSTNAKDIAVLAGHTSHQSSNAAFNIFYNWKKGVFTLKPGDEIWVQTKKSGSRWLVYKATDLLTPKKYAAGNKVSLMNDPKVWGTVPTPGVLITIGCLQPKDISQHSSENIVIKWKFDRVEG
ncbi:hypothetical protein H7Y29_03325 [Microbacteriaceae bacterium]|nr:hypothetical protein [Candidatus Saccharibacteria bacterium]